MDLLKVVREAVGFAEPRPEDHVREDELSVVPAIELQLSTGFRPAVIDRWLRAWADSLRRGAETEADWWKTEVEQRLLEGGMTEGEMLGAQADLGSRMAPLSEQALLAIYHGQQEHAWRQTFVGGRRGRAGAGRSVQSVAPSAGDLLPRHHRVHPVDLGAGGRGRRGSGGEAGHPGPSVLSGTRGAAGEVARRRGDVLFPRT
jgi:hypothetical protein